MEMPCVIDGVAPLISSRDLAFFHALADNDVMKYNKEILTFRDWEFTGHLAGCRDSFVIVLDPSSYPPRFGVFPHDYELQFTLYATTRQFSDTPSAEPGAPSHSNSIDIHIVVPYGKEKVIVPYSSDMANSLFGSKTQLQMANRQVM